MRPTITICLVPLFALAAPARAADATEYLLLPMRFDVDKSMRANVIEPPHPVSFKADDCGITAMVGASSELQLGEKSEHYSGTAYSSELKVEGSGRVSGFVMAHALKVGTELADFRPLEEGQTCTETIDGKIQVFRKYSAVLRQPQ
jgi:hypothetical protein